MSPIPVFLTRLGYPSFHRRMMYVKDKKANPKSSSEDLSLYQKVRFLKSSFTSLPYEISIKRLPRKGVRERSNFGVPSSRTLLRQQLLNLICICCRKEKEF
ncbi:hypothetical protein M9H77_23608 [Catharanthus roseus]|uniref:Uncharacterized protein n=1 Tax=Catharanthus roseus TaxID=4058 RepID=A0ACC0ATT3_CATRO|nr:hypothetical protein M9H77_23608 [Catharanthus roseus]